MRALKSLLLVCATLLSGGLAQAVTLDHSYLLQGSLADSLGGPSLVAQGGTLSATGYSFAANQGLTLSGAIKDAGDYSIELQFSFAEVSGWRKIVDFKDLHSDDGLYVYHSALDYCVCGTQHEGVDGAFTPGQTVDIILTRDKATQAVSGYVNGVKQAGLSFTDTSSSAVFAPDTFNLVHFFQDDLATGGSEASAGQVTKIAIFNGALSAEAAACVQGGSASACGIAAAVPEPANYALLGLGLCCIGALRRLRR